MPRSRRSSKVVGDVGVGKSVPAIELRTEWKLSLSGEGNGIEAKLPRKASSQRGADRTANRHR